MNKYNVDQDYIDMDIEEGLEFIYDKLEEGICVDENSLNEEFPGLLNKLKKFGLIKSDINGQIDFTEEGSIQGTKIIRRHRLAERLLTDVLFIEDDILEDKACIFEHIIKKEVESRVCALLGHPKICPHNKSIPPGECCKKKLEVKKIIAPLIELNVGDKGIIAYLNTRNEAILEKLLAIGILPGENINIIKTSPAFAVRVGTSQFAFDYEVASNIFIRIIDT